MADKKYTVFISSTLRDLEAERKLIMEAVLEDGHIPIGMEGFSATDLTSWDLITTQIDQSDYYIVVVAHNYGSEESKSGISYTEKEYDYAVQKGIPALGFLIDPKAEWDISKGEKDAKRIKKLDKFKQKIKDRNVSFWTTRDQLPGKCIAALNKEMRRFPRPGWVRATDMPGPEVLTEIARLSKENSSLRDENNTLKKLVAESKTRDEDASTVNVSFTYSVSNVFGVNEVESVTLTTTWNSLFIDIAERLLAFHSELALEEGIKTHFIAELDDKVEAFWKRVRSNSSIYNKDNIHRYVDNQDLKAIKAHYFALGLIKIEHQAQMQKIKTIWKLSDEGVQYYGEVRSRLIPKAQKDL